MLSSSHVYIYHMLILTILYPYGFSFAVRYVSWLLYMVPCFLLSFRFM